MEEMNCDICFQSAIHHYVEFVEGQRVVKHRCEDHYEGETQAKPIGHDSGTRFERLLETSIEYNADAIVLKVGEPPAVDVGGDLLAIDREPLDFLTYEDFEDALNRIQPHLPINPDGSDFAFAYGGHLMRVTGYHKDDSDRLVINIVRPVPSQRQV